MSEYTIVSTLRELCIKNDWFNAGTNSQYDRMFELAKDLVKNAADPNLAVFRLADVIWICTADVSFHEIYIGIETWFNERRKELAR